MQIEKTMNFAFNYTITRATDEVLAKIYAEKYGFKDFSKFLSWRGKLLKRCQKEIPEILRNYKGKLLDQVKVWKGHNIVPSICRNELASLISGNTVTPTFKANYLAVGSGSTATSNADVTLVTETFRGLFTNRFSVDNVAYLDKFFSSAEVGGLTINEVGVFVDGAAGANTGFLLSRILANEVMNATETLTVNATFTIV